MRPATASALDDPNYDRRLATGKYLILWLQANIIPSYPTTHMLHTTRPHHATLSSTIPFYSQFGYGGCGTEAGLNLRLHVARQFDQLGLGFEKSMFSAVYSGGNAKLASGAQAEHQDKGNVLRIRSGQ